VARIRLRAVGVGNVFSKAVKKAWVWNGGLEYVGTREISVEGTSETRGGGLVCRGSCEKEETKLEAEEAGASSDDFDTLVGLFERSV